MSKRNASRRIIMAKPQSMARVEFRMSPQLKKEVEEAATLLGTTFTSFATEVLVERSRQIKRDYNQTVMGDEERDAFMQLILGGEEPSDALVKLMATKVTL
ncbi:MAG TPA: DUF1778 domain-containing protein [Fimbriimonas sp.]|nr:DUF1778 domain-containing protein [Fimbriimonas sp.]